jgi:hypothetical protein
MSDPTDKLINERLHAIFPTKEIADRMLDLVVTKKPIGVSRKAYYPYYKEYYAKWIKPWIDSMIETKQSIVFEFSIFCANGEMSEQTLYNKVNQSSRYLIDFMDTPNLTYALWRKTVDFHRKDPVRKGVVIEFIKELRENFAGDSPQPRMIVAREDGLPKWRHNMNEWLEGNMIYPFIQEGLALTPEVVRELKLELHGLKGIMATVNATAVKIVKANE